MHYKKIKCPTCEKEIMWETNNINRPFCSERCKLIDLGEWASDKRYIPGDAISAIPSDENNND